jgi:hypothetical protein
MANQFKNTQLAVSHTIATLTDSNMLLGTIDKQYSSKFKDKTSGAKVGSEIDIKKPFVPVIVDGVVASGQDYAETYVTLKLDVRKNALIPFDSFEETLNLDDFNKCVSEPVGYQMGAEIEMAAYAKLLPSIGNLVIATGDDGGGAATGLTNYDVIKGGIKMTQGTASTSGRTLLIDPLTEGFYINENRNQFNNQAEISRQYVDSYVGHANGYMWGRSNRLPSITLPADIAGAVAVTYVNGASTISVDNFGIGQTIMAGTVFTIATVKAVGIQTKEILGHEFQFSVKETVVVSGSGTATLEIEPVYSGATGGLQGLQNVNILPTSGLVITLAGVAGATYRQSIGYVKEAFTMGTADLALPTGGALGARDAMDGVSGRIVRGWDVKLDEDLPRFDVLCGFLVLRPELAVKYWVRVV